MDKKLTVRDLKQALAKLDDDAILIYSHDDEGNEFQRVINLPSVAYVRIQDNYRFLELYEPDNDRIRNPSQRPDLYEKCVVIN